MKIINDSIEKFLYWDCPLGWPSKALKVYVDFEVGGAYEDYGWVVELENEIIACDKNLFECLLKARNFIKKKLDI